MAQISEAAAAAAETFKDTGEPARGEMVGVRDVTLALAGVVIALVVYGRTVTLGLLAGDGGEFQTLTHLLGNTHPTGYPVYLVLARLYALLPLGDLAYRVNLFSAVMGAAAVGGLYLCGKVLTGLRAASLAAALALAVAPTFWSQALIAEVYTAGAVFVVFVMLAMVYWDRTGDNRALFAAGVLGGLSVGIHMSVALLAPAVVLFLALHWRRGRPMWTAAVLGGATGLALTVAFFLILDRNNPPAGYFNSVVEPSHSAWGMAAEDIDGPLEHLLYGWQARQFRYLMFADVESVMVQQAADYADNLVNEFAPLALALAAIGALGLIIRRPRVAALLLVALVIQLVTFFNYEIWDLYVFYIPSYVLIALLAAAGLGVLAAALRWVGQRWLPEPAGRAGLLDVTLAALMLGLAVLPVLEPRWPSVLAGEVTFEFDEYPVFDENLRAIATATVADLPPDALVLTGWDMMWPYYFAAHVAGERTDLMFVETYPADDQVDPAESLLDFVVESLDERPVLVEQRLSQIEAIDGLKMSPLRIGPTIMYAVIEE